MWCENWDNRQETMRQELWDRRHENGDWDRKCERRHKTKDVRQELWDRRQEMETLSKIVLGVNFWIQYTAQCAIFLAQLFPLKCRAMALILSGAVPWWANAMAQGYIIYVLYIEYGIKAHSPICYSRYHLTYQPACPPPQDGKWRVSKAGNLPPAFNPPLFIGQTMCSTVK